ncbi:MAG: acyl-CoA dehydrogenase family protein, partial [Proteobacteria bacterium]|nr:acyl-CoA dehydrogenase family protein [Pseudomonadota bacterium]
IRDGAHRFANEVMLPIGRKLDLLSAAEVVAAGSPLWQFLAAFQNSGLMDFEALDAMSPEQKARNFPLIFEELGWGDSGLAIVALATSLPALTVHALGNAELKERFMGVPGCWLATQPDRGSEVVDMDARDVYPGTRQSRGNVAARLVGDEYIINGQSSAWVSGAPIAQNALAYIPCDYGDGLYNEGGGLHHVAILVPFDLPGVSKGKPLEKLGQRPLPQGEIFFNEVRVPARYAIATREKALISMLGTLTFANMEMAITFTGVARAAFEHALVYVHERKQGGTALINHQSVRLRIFDMWRKLEAGRALAKRVFNYNYSPNGPHLLASITSKTYCTQMALEVTNEAIQLFGGNGLTREYPVEKLMRDARASLIEDGENNILSLKGCDWLSRWYQKQQGH